MVGQSMGRALIVEDDALLITILNDLVEAMGFDVTSTGDAEDARRACNATTYNLVLADLKLNGDAHAGARLADEVTHRHAATRVVVVSGYPRPAELADDILFLQKPFTVAQLQRAIESFQR